MEYTKTWNTVEVSPGIVSFSFFQSPEGMSQEDFQEYWFCSHTPFALDIHPLWRYERNVVAEALTPDAPNYAGIVPLHLENDSDLNFNNFFSGDGNNPIATSLRVQADVSNFIDLSKIETTAMREYVLVD